MSGYSLPVLPKYFVDFSTLATGSSLEVVLADRVPLLHWRSLICRVRVHSHTVRGSNSIEIRVYPQAWTEEDPGIPFLVSNYSQGGLISGPTPSPFLSFTTIPTAAANALAAMARITVVGTRSSVGGFNANFS